MDSGGTLCWTPPPSVRLWLALATRLQIHFNHSRVVTLPVRLHSNWAHWRPSSQGPSGVCVCGSRYSRVRPTSEYGSMRGKHTQSHMLLTCSVIFHVYVLRVNAKQCCQSCVTIRCALHWTAVCWSNNTVAAVTNHCFHWTMECPNFWFPVYMEVGLVPAVCWQRGGTSAFTDMRQNNSLTIKQRGHDEMRENGFIG